MLFKVLKITVAVIFLFCLSLKAQDKMLDSIGKNLANNSRNISSSLLFVHFDKNVFTNNNQVWFTAYLLKLKFADSLYNSLYVSLISNQDSTVILQESFLIEKGIAFGGFILPDSILTGDYRFVVNTNVKNNNKPDGEFIQPVYIKSTTINSLEPKLSIFKSYDDKTKNGTALLRALSSDNHFVPDAMVRYTIGRGNNILLKGIAKTSIIGEVMIDYPADKITDENNLISVSIEKGKLKKYVKFEIPYKTIKKYNVQFYPEGGYLINGLESKVGFEIKDTDGATIKSKAVLFEDDVVVDTIFTNSTGIGSFSLRPLENAKYRIKLLDELGDEVYYDLPKALNKGVVIKLDSAVPEKDLIGNFQSNYKTKIHVLVHNYNKIFHHVELNMEAMKMQRLRFKIDSVPIGLTNITVLDSNYMPLADRVFFAHQNQINKIEIASDKEEYFTRDKVAVQLKISSENIDYISGMVSMAFTQSNRLSVYRYSNIVDYAYLQNDLGQLPANPTGTKFNDLNYLENVLLVKTWSKYKWPSEQIKLDQQLAPKTYQYFGTILGNDRPLNVPVDINLISKKIKFISTDSLGNFHVDYRNLITLNERFWIRRPDNEEYFDYSLKLSDPFEVLKVYHKNLPNNNVTYSGNKVLNEMIKIPSVKAIKLKDVIILSGNKFIIGNDCGDYVCFRNVLNCPKHVHETTNRPARIGEYYLNHKLVRIRYEGCGDIENNINFTLLKGVKLPKEFYISDITNKNEPINFATVYWNYQILIDNKRPKFIEFNTGDLTGKFKIIVQGISSRGLIYGEKEITVNKR